jgi:RNA-directed DNA polymerase
MVITSRPQEYAAAVTGADVLTAAAVIELAAWVQHHHDSWTPMPVRRVLIPKGNGKRRAPEIPVVGNRCSCRR